MEPVTVNNIAYDLFLCKRFLKDLKKIKKVYRNVFTLNK